MAESVKNRKLSLRELLEELVEDDEFSDEDRKRAREEVKKLEEKK